MTLSQFCKTVFGTRKLEWWGYQAVKKNNNILGCFYKEYKCNGSTDRIIVVCIMFAHNRPCGQHQKQCSNCRFMKSHMQTWYAVKSWRRLFRAFSFFVASSSTVFRRDSRLATFCTISCRWSALTSLSTDWDASSSWLTLDTNCCNSCRNVWNKEQIPTCDICSQKQTFQHLYATSSLSNSSGLYIF